MKNVDCETADIYSLILAMAANNSCSSRSSNLAFSPSSRTFHSAIGSSAVAGRKLITVPSSQ